ncbi:acetyl-coenzyme-A carboxylase [Malassezia vespertilionis]|uniref:acetyl-coenzyme-A carboxylase n=1 Tax=Malassezia vespertilionis TaxID=2020962 RepID=UPI0024B260EF|nr:acetyl-coenzyme-A carboxylase [Malassezia vespertilionis]WFD07033.1 acetyl-coenzyme-A carboxylase [Malassezia vespertilionis]
MSSVKDFVHHHGGHSVVTKILISNNGIAAVKEIRSVRKWAYETFGNDRAIQFTVMATPEDLSVNAEYIRMADQFVEVPGGPNGNNYANVDLIVDIAERAGVDAVWAGWGHASENPRLPEALSRLNPRILFIGPPGSAMRSLGDKISSTIVAQHADVPCMPWSGTGITDTIVGPEGYLTVSDEVYQQACVHSAEEGLESALRIGFPVMIKASEGGGGKGIRMCASADDFSQLYHAAVGEVPGSPIFIMKLAGQARHLEVQLIADQYGNAMSLFGRDCSVQRRHQKIIEEAPVTIAPKAARIAMEQAAVRLAKLVGYVSAGTVEWLYSPDTNEFAFLELNPRLQVEHPTTEMVTSVNIPATQLQIAMGIPLYRIAAIRELYGLPLTGTEKIDFGEQPTQRSPMQIEPAPHGHVIACRITAENPDTGFKPGVGMLTELNFRSSTSTWGYFSVNAAGALHEYADSQFGHVFAYGKDREEARKNMIFSLKELSIRGEFRTTVEYLIMLLETEAFTESTFTTGWLDRLIQDKATAERPSRDLAVICGAAVKAHELARECEEEYKRILHRGQVPPRNTIRIGFPVEFIYDHHKYHFTVTRSSRMGLTLQINGQTIRVSLRPLRDGGLLIGIAEQSYAVYSHEEVGQMRLSIDGRTCLIEEENDPSQICSPSPGKLVRLLVESGAHVSVGQTIAEIEVMKMYLPLMALENGVVTFVKSPGVSLNPGDLLGILAVDDPTKIQRAALFTGMLPEFGAPDIAGSKPQQRFEAALAVFNAILEGYDQDELLEYSLKELVETMQMPELPYLQCLQAMSSLSGRLPGTLEDELRGMLEDAQQANVPFPAKALRDKLDAAIAGIADATLRMALEGNVAHLYAVFDDYAGGGLRYYEMTVFSRMLEKYFEVESQFSSGPEAVLHLRASSEGDLSQVVALQISHAGIQRKNTLLTKLFDRHIRQSGMVSKTEHSQRMVSIVRKLSTLGGLKTAPVALKARETLLSAEMPSLEERKEQMGDILRSSVASADELHAPQLGVLRELSDTAFNVFDVLPVFFYDAQLPVAYAALITYVIRAYRAYDIVSFNFGAEKIGGEARALITWHFQMSQDVLLNRAKDKERQASSTDLAEHMHRRTRPKLRLGLMTSCAKLAQLSDTLAAIIKYFGSKATEPVNVLNIAVTHEEEMSASKLVAWIGSTILGHCDSLNMAGLRRVTVLVCHAGIYPLFVTYRRLDSGEWREQRAIQNVEPALSYQLELDRITKNFEVTPVPMSSSTVHLYYARGLANRADIRFFVRALIRPGRPTANVPLYLLTESDRVLNDILNMLEVALGRPEYCNADASHIFMSFLYPLEITLEELLEMFDAFVARHGARMTRLRVIEAEIRIVLQTPNGPRPMRVFVTTETSFTLRKEVYDEVIDSNGAAILKPLGLDPHSALQRKSAHQAYQNRLALQMRRSRAFALGTTFAYDLIDALRHALRRSFAADAPKEPVRKVEELVFDSQENLLVTVRPPAQNKIGMVAWRLVIQTPECPDGRPLMLIANDVTLFAGSFGPVEDRFFAQVSRRARAEGIPLLYVSSNSGARIGLATEPMDLFQVKFTQDDPSKGFDYLYLDDQGMQAIAKSAPGSVKTREHVLPDGTKHHILTDLIGKPDDGLGVECLSGSGLIAGEMSRARHSIFTTTIVTGRSVGIGAYLARLGGRVIQVETSPMILTGFQALNKLLGREVYTSNLQLGGPQIMYTNGVSHLRVDSDLAAMGAYLRWLAYVPVHKNAPLLVLPSSDPVERPVSFVPTATPYDPRALIQGTEVDGVYCAGLFDRDSFQETLAGWATSVVVGRARLGGIPFGVIAVETRTLERIVPADPANPNSTEQRIFEAGQVWYPNSAYKTAQAIEDFEHEGLPLVMLANWRGFSGGQQDMYDEILKQGSKIVDALSTYSQPVFVHIPPAAELRGGSWVVIDSAVNSNGMIEMSADTDSARGGVLEAAGMVEIKFRADKRRAAMDRLDPTYAQLANALRGAQDEAPVLKTRLEEREKQLSPFFVAIATEYADAHDRAGRMLATGVLRCAVPWADTRAYFFWRTRRRLAEVRVQQELQAADAALSHDACYAILHKAAAYCDTDADQDAVRSIQAHAPQIAAAVTQVKVAALQAQIDALESDSRARLLADLLP